MHTVIRRYQDDPKALAELARKVGESAREIITTIPGFVAYALADDGKGTALSVGTFEDKAGADESTRRAAAGVRDNVADLRLNPPTVLEGQVRIRKSAPGVRPKHVVLLNFNVNRSSADE